MVMTVTHPEGVSGLIVAAILPDLLANVIGCVIVGWYLYLKPNVQGVLWARSSGIANAA